LFDGTINVIIACPLPAVATTPVGAFDVVAGIIEFEVEDEALVPTPFVAVTVNVYVIPLVKPVIVIGDVVPVVVKLPMLEVTV
jgi:hypothetical protein